MIIDYIKIPAASIAGMRGGEGVLTIQKITQEGCTLARITLPPHTSIGPHIHADDEEYVVVESGTGECLNGDLWVPISAGMVHLNKQGEHHSIRNQSNNNLVIIAYIYRK